jgi:ABC-2 type transport system ATP-binding protein
VQGVAKSYGSNRAVDGITFEIAEGEVVAILGPNGAEKTTTVEMIEGSDARWRADGRLGA